MLRRGFRDTVDARSVRRGTAVAVALLVGLGVSGGAGTPHRAGSETPGLEAMAGDRELDGERAEAELLENTNGEAALEFRHLQKIDENGKIPDNALLDAAAHVDLMKAAAGATGGDTDIAGVTPASWEWLGPGNIGGRIRSILIDPTTPNTMWVGSVTGGIFKTTNGGSTWTQLDDFMANLAVSALAAHPTTPNTIYASTGEYFTGSSRRDDSGNRGAGVFKSTNGGPWSQLAATSGSDWWYTNRLSVSPTSPNTLLAATWAGIFRTVNGGTDWNQELSGEVVLDVDFNPSDGTKAIAGGRNGRALFSTDGGDSWQLATGIPPRTQIASRSGTRRATRASHMPPSISTVARSTAAPTAGRPTRSPAPTPTDVDYLAAQGNYTNALWVSPAIRTV